jgi:uncharacterized protein (TIGR02594 family)
VTSDEVSWCAAFVGACLAQASIPNTIDRDDRLLARAYLKFGTPIETPRIGAIVVMSRGDPKSWTGHVGFVVGETARTVAVLGGNQSNAVNVRHFSKDIVLGYRWPGPAKTPAQVAAEGSRTVAAASGVKRDAAIAGGSVAAPVAVSAAPPVVPDMPDIGGIAGQAGELKKHLELLTDFGSFVGTNIVTVTLVVAAYFAARIVWRSGLIQKFRTEDANTGKTNA